MVHEDIEIVIRPYEARDRAAIRRINYETAFLHKPHLFFDDPEIVADALTRYFTDYEPGSCFVAEARNEVIGYVIGTLDIKRMNWEYSLKISLLLFFKSLMRGIFFKCKTYRFFWNVLKSYVKGEFFVPDFTDKYPSTFHINVRDGFRGQGVGSRLILSAVKLLQRSGVPGVQFSTMSGEPIHFFQSMGFHIIYQSRRTYLKYALGVETPFYLFGMDVI